MTLTNILGMMMCSIQKFILSCACKLDDGCKEKIKSGWQEDQVGEERVALCKINECILGERLESVVGLQRVGKTEVKVLRKLLMYMARWRERNFQFYEHGVSFLPSRQCGVKTAHRLLHMHNKWANYPYSWTFGIFKAAKKFSVFAWSCYVELFSWILLVEMYIGMYRCIYTWQFIEFRKKSENVCFKLLENKYFEKWYFTRIVYQYSFWR